MISELNNLYGVSGLEKEIRLYIESKVKDICNEIYVDSIGNLHAIKNNGNKNICLVTNMDEPGIIITQITDDGYLKFDTIGRINPSFLISKKVIINNIVGIISLKAIHLASKEEREKPVKTDQLFVDIGANSKDEAEQLIDIGDYGVIEEEFTLLNDNYIKGRALGGRIGCLTAIDILKQNLKCNLHIVFSAQREINNRGIQVGINGISADLAIIFDAIEAINYHNKDKRPDCGQGCVILSRTGAGNMDKNIISMVNDIAKKNDISIQNYISSDKGPEYEVIKNNSINSCLCINLPVKYIKSSVQTANINDVDSMKNISIAVINEICKGE